MSTGEVASPDRGLLWTGARLAALRAAYGGGAIGTLGALGYAVLRVEAKLARVTIGEPTTRPPRPGVSWGRGRRGRTPLRLAVLGDSSAAGLGCDSAEQTPGALLAGSLARELRRRVLLDVQARSARAARTSTPRSPAPWPSRSTSR